MNFQVMRPYNGGKDIFMIKDAKLKFKNFSGKQGKNPNGSRTVNVVVDEEDEAPKKRRTTRTTAKKEAKK